MAKVQSEQRGAPLALPALTTQLTDIGRYQFDMWMKLQKHVLQTAEDFGETWTAHADAEGALVSELMKKLAAVNAFPDAASAYQECASRQLELLSQQNKRLFENTEKTMTRGVKLLSNGQGLST